MDGLVGQVPLAKAGPSAEVARRSNELILAQVLVAGDADNGADQS